MATVGVIKIASEFSIAGLKKGADNAIGVLNKFQTQTSSVTAAVTGMAGVVAGAAGAYGIGALVKSSMEGIDSTARLADRLGVTTEDLSRLEYAAGQARIPAETLTGALEGLNTSLVEVARTGSGGAVVALRKLKLNAADLAAQGPVSALKQIAGALNTIPSAAERAATATEIFGGAGQEILALSQQGAGGIAALEAEADQLGITIGSLDAAKVVEAESAMSKLSSAVGAVGNRIAIELAPYITEASSYLVSLAKDGGTAGTVLSGAFGAVKTSAGALLDVFDALRAGVRNVFGYMLEGISWTLGGLHKLVGALDSIVEKLTGVRTGLAETLSLDAFSQVADQFANKQFEHVTKYLEGPSTKDVITDWSKGIQAAATERAQLKVAAKPMAQGINLEKIPQIAGVAKLGSKEAATAVAKFRVGINPNDQIKTVAGNTGKANELLIKATAGINRIADAVTKAPMVATSTVG